MPSGQSIWPELVGLHHQCWELPRTAQQMYVIFEKSIGFGWTDLVMSEAMSWRSSAMARSWWGKEPSVVACANRSENLMSL